MRLNFCLLLIFAITALAACAIASQMATGQLQGTIRFITKTPSTDIRHKVVLQCILLNTTARRTAIIPSMTQLYRVQPLFTQLLSLAATATRDNQTTLEASFTVSNLPLDMHYALYAFADVAGDQRLSVEQFAAQGWFANRSANLAIAAISLTATQPCQRDLTVQLFRSTPYKEASCESGRLEFKRGHIPVMNLWGSDLRQRGFAHGFLAAQQIVDWFRFYLLEEVVRDPQFYERKVVPMLVNRMKFDESFLLEAQGIIDGMAHAKTDHSSQDLFIPELNRFFKITEIMAINSYIEIESFVSEQAITIEERRRSACSQFAIWNDKTLHDRKLKGQLIAGRNMDGEIDIRKMTVSHFIVFAVNQTSLKLKSFVSMMWPGFIGSLSAVNEDGLYGMMNVGSTPRVFSIDQAYPVTLLVQRVIDSTSSQDATPQNVQSKLQNLKSATGGSCSTGCVLLFARPIESTGINPRESAFIYEGAYQGGLVRIAGQTTDLPGDNVVIATNHFHTYGVDPDIGPRVNFGIPVYFSSLWRYESTSQLLQSWERNTVIRPVTGRERITKLLQTSAHGSTEHSIIVEPSAVAGRHILSISLAKMALPSFWDAPYLEFADFLFNEFFM